MSRPDDALPRCGCGGNVAVMEHDRVFEIAPGYLVECPNCGTRTTYWHTPEQATAVWTRAMTRPALAAAEKEGE